MPNHDIQHHMDLTATVVTWLDTPHAEQIARQTAEWDAQTLCAVRRAMLMQGIGPYLHQRMVQTQSAEGLEDGLREWLDHHRTVNAQRIRLLHEELHAILHAANRTGLRVMPLKGSVLSLCYYAEPGLRPMADIDVLIPPEELDALSDILRDLHYRLELSPYIYPNHHRFVNLRADTVVSLHDEHPHNPRPVEVHTELKRSMWQSSGTYDITDYLWQESQPCELLGEIAWLPAPDRLLTYVAIHACTDFMLGKGRALQWLDLAHLVQRGAAPDLTLDRRHATWIYPVLKLASRALPQHFAATDLRTLADRIHPHLQRWAATVPLDAACGLINQPVQPDLQHESARSRFVARWRRWRPDPWRLRIGYPHVPLPLAYGHHFLNLTARGWDLLRRG